MGREGLLMAGSLNHIADAGDGTFNMELIDNMGDAREALEECHQVIALLLSKLPPRTLIETCNALGYPTPKHVPVLEPKRWGPSAGITMGTDVPATVEALKAKTEDKPVSVSDILKALSQGFGQGGINSLTMDRVSGALRTASRIIEGGRG
jgi:hypothetical protein